MANTASAAEVLEPEVLGLEVEKKSAAKKTTNMKAAAKKAAALSATATKRRAATKKAAATKDADESKEASVAKKVSAKSSKTTTSTTSIKSSSTTKAAKTAKSATTSKTAKSATTSKTAKTAKTAEPSSKCTKLAKAAKIAPPAPSGHNKSLGKRGEDAAARFLANHGYTILERNYKCSFGEADIVAKSPGTLVFVEVKTRTDEDKGMPEEAITEAKRAKYEKIAISYLRNYDEVDISVRFDVIGILVVAQDRAIIRHHINAFGVG